MLRPDDVLPDLLERQRIRGVDRLERIDERVRQRPDPPHRRREPGLPGIFFYGGSQTFLPFGAGFRCVDGNLFRLPVVFCDSTGSPRTRSTR